MDWVKLATNYYNDPALMRAGEAAEVLFTRALAYAGDQETDGVIPTEALPRFGLSVDLVLYGPTYHQGNYVDILRSGAGITLLERWSPPEIERAQKEIVDTAGRQGRHIYVVPTGATNETTLAAGVELARELAQQEREQGVTFDFVIFATASGGTHAGLEIGLLWTRRPWSLIGVGVSNDPEFFRRRIAPGRRICAIGIMDRLWIRGVLQL